MHQIKTIGIIGSGKMGTDIFNYLSDFNFQLKWFILFEDEKEKLHKSFQKKISRQLKHSLINDEKFNFKNSYIFSNDLLDFSDCDLIIESVSEEIQLKQQVFIRLNHIVNKNCLFVSNSSSILPSRLSSTRIITGMHFFYPVAFKNYVELIKHEGVDSSIYETLKDFLRSINKKVFEQDETNAFLLNRFLLEIQLKGYDLIKSHQIDYIHFDRIVSDLIPDFGVFEMMDQVGLQTMFNAISNYAELDDYPNRFNLLLQEIQDKINTDTPFCNINDDHEINPDLEKYLYNDIKYFIHAVAKDYSERYKLELLVLKNSLNDFCGIVL